MTKKTTDIYFAAALLSLGAKLESVDREDVHHMEFEFAKPADTENVGFGLTFLEDKELEWASNSLLVNAQEYADAIRRMKSLVHSH